MFRGALQDLRYAVRMLRRNPGFTAVAVLTLALGIGANSAIFSVANAVILRPLPFREPARIVTVLETKASQHLDWLFVTPNNFAEWQRRANVFESLAAYQGCGYRLAQDGEPRLITGNCASASFFSILGVQPIMGRLWSPEEDAAGNDHVALVSYEFWQAQFGGDPNVIGKSVWRASDRSSFAIIGVLPAGFQFERDDVSVWTPLGFDAKSPANRNHNYTVIARLKPGVTVEQAQTSMSGIADQLEREFPATNTGWGVTVGPMQRFFADLGNTRTTLLILLGAVGLLLLIACANIANLLLARATARQREIAVRVAIGATRLRLVRQFLTESLLLGLLGGSAGFLLAWVTFKPLIAITPRLPSFSPNALRIDAQVFLFSMGVSVFASVLFGLTPALRVSRRDLNECLREAGRGTRGSARSRLTRQLLVVGEIGLAIVLLVATGLLVESLRNLKNDRLGFNASHVLTINMCCLDNTRYGTQQQISTFYKQLFDRLQGLPGVAAVSSTTQLPLGGFDGAGSVFAIQGRPPAQPGHETVTDARLVGANFFQTMEIPLARGRDFTTQDDENHQLIAVINETMARRYFPDSDPIGQQIQLVNLQPLGRWFTIVGIAKDSRDRGLGKETRCTLYFHNLQNLIRGSALVVRTKADPETLVTSVRETVRTLNQDVSLGNPRTLEQALDQSLSAQRFSTTLLTLFAVLALLLASVGVYGVVTYLVMQRTHEIGIRLALGAGRRDIMSLVLGQGVRLALGGIALGVVGAIASTRLMSSLLFGVSARDPFTLIVVSVVLGAVALLACYLPARRATKVDPLEALRSE
jgi:putative ABC transport system permease protein